MSHPAIPGSMPHAASFSSGSPPPQQSLRRMMAQAAAVASAATGGVSDISTRWPIETLHPRPAPMPRPVPGRRHSTVNQLPSTLPSESRSDVTYRGAPLPPVKDGIRLQRVLLVAEELKKSYEHPANTAQIENEILHHVRAILFMNRTLITQSFVSHVTGVSQGSLSHYVRGLFRGNQTNVDQRLTRFVEQFASGELDQYIEEIRAGVRSAARPLYLPPQPPPVAVPQQPTPLAVEKTPIPPPPPPQLQPAPWTHPAPQLMQHAAHYGSPAQLTPKTKYAANTIISSVENADKARTDSLPNAVEQAGQHIADQSFGQDISQQRLTPQSTAVDQLNNVSSENVSSKHVRRTLRRRRPQQFSSPDMQQSGLMFPEPNDDIELTPTVAVDRAFHSLVAAEWAPDAILAEPLLIPVEIYVESDGYVLYTFIQWDVNERALSPELAADRLRRNRGLPTTFIKPVAAQIRRALFDAGVPCAAPPSRGPAENRRILRFSVELESKTKDSGPLVISDEVEWDLAGHPFNSPELFARQLCQDEGIAHRHALKIAQAIRQKLSIAQAISYGNQETRQAALAMVANDDPLRFSLETVRSALIKCAPVDNRSRERSANERKVLSTIFTPLLDDVIDEASRRADLRKRKEVEKNMLREYEQFKRREAEKIAQREAALEQGVKRAEEEAVHVYRERNLDFRPYLALVVARGERPSVWMPPAFDRRRRKQLTFPMVQQNKRTNASKLTRSARPFKRRRTFRDALSGDEENIYLNAASNNEIRDDTFDSEMVMEEDMKINKKEETITMVLPLKLRIKPADDFKTDSSRINRRRRR